jgi:uncharacterized membrane protein
MTMRLIGNFHPLLVHFPIALVLAAAAAELVAIATPGRAWRTVAVSNVRAGAAIGLAAVVTGWLFASSPAVDVMPALEWHRWIGIAGTMSAAGAALMSLRPYGQSRRSDLTYRVALFGAALLVGLAGHLGGTLVWGTALLRP